MQHVVSQVRSTLESVPFYRGKGVNHKSKNFSVQKFDKQSYIRYNVLVIAYIEQLQHAYITLASYESDIV